MTTFLLEVNVLIALIDPAHVQHDQAHEWLSRTGRKSFATCPITENGLLRIVGHPKYPTSPGPSSAVAQALAAMRALTGHEFWPDSISLADDAQIDIARSSSYTQVTDAYFLALARSRGQRLASIDRRMVVDAVHDGRKALELI